MKSIDNNKYRFDFEKVLLSGEEILWYGKTVRNFFCRAYAITNKRLLKLKKSGKIKSLELQYFKEIWVSGTKRKSVSYYCEKSRVTERGLTVTTSLSSAIYGIESAEEVFKILDSALYHLNDDEAYEKQGENENGKNIQYR